MLRAALPVGVFMFTSLSMAPAEAARCPAGKFYRVSLEICQSKTTAMKEIKSGKASKPTRATKAEKLAKGAENIRSAKVALPPPRPDLENDRDDDPAPDATPRRTETSVARSRSVARRGTDERGKSDTLPAPVTSFSPYGGLSPFGALR